MLWSKQLGPSLAWSAPAARQLDWSCVALHTLECNTTTRVHCVCCEGQQHKVVNHLSRSEAPSRVQTAPAVLQLAGNMAPDYLQRIAHITTGMISASGVLGLALAGVAAACSGAELLRAFGVQVAYICSLAMILSRMGKILDSTIQRAASGVQASLHERATCNWCSNTSVS
jgi:hypothetical protein